MRSRTFRRGGNVSLYNAAATGLLPLSLLAWQQYLKNKNNRRFNTYKKSNKYKSKRFTRLRDPFTKSQR